MNETSNQPDAAKLAEYYAHLREQREQIETQMEIIKGELRKLGPGEHDAGEYTVAITPNRRIAEKKVLEAYPPGDYPEFYQHKPNVIQTRARLAETDIEPLMGVVGAPKVMVI